MLGALGPVQFAVISVTGDGALVTAVTNKKIRIMALAVTPEVGTAAVFVLESNTTAITGVMNIAANTPMVWPFSDNGWCETAKGEALNIDFTSGNLYGVLVYQEVT